MFEVASQVIDNEKQRKKSTSLNAKSPEEEAKLLLEAERAKAALYDPDVVSPLVRLMYDFFLDPYSSKTAFIWAQLTAWIAVTRVLEIAFESCDGPNQYAGRPTDNARYHFFLTDNEYFKVYVACMVPLIIDAVGRGIMLGFMLFVPENNALLAELREDGLQVFMLFADIVGVIPFFVTAIYIRPYDVPQGQLENVIMTLLELLITARILRLIKDLPAIRSIRIALLNSVDHLVLPVFFFFTFNITSGVFLYFVEPCFNVNTCPWHDLFESSFFSIVTMTTTGYGNQVPSYEFGRFVACCVMLFGALFLSMPLAIIGNEYSSAWTMISEENEAKKKALEDQKVSATATILTHSRMQNELKRSSSDVHDSSKKKLSAGHLPGIIPPSTPSLDAQDEAAAAAPSHSDEHIAALAAAEAERKRREFESEKAIVVTDPVITTQKNLFETVLVLKEACAGADFISPAMMLQYCELQATLPAFLTSLRNELTYLLRERHRQMAGLESLITATAEAEAKTAGKRRLSMFHNAKDTAAVLARNKQLVAIKELENEDDTSSVNNMSRANSTNTNGRANSNSHVLEAFSSAIEESPLNTPLGSPAPTAARKSSQPRAAEGASADNGGASGGGVAVTKSGARANSSVNAIALSALSPLRNRRVAPDNTPASSSNTTTTNNNNTNTNDNNEKARLTNNDPPQFRSRSALVVPNGESFDSTTDNHNESSQSPRDRLDSTSSDKITTGGSSGGGFQNGLRRTLSQRQTLFRLSINSVRSRHSMYNRLKNVVGTTTFEELRARTSSADFEHQVKVLSRNPQSYRNRLWIMLEIPNSSREAKVLQFILIFLISFSIFILYTQTITNLTLYGENAGICGSVLNIYCSDKHDVNKDPGCFVQFPNGTSSDVKVEYDCDHDYCFKHAYNFGSDNTTMMCHNLTHPPFQDTMQLENYYGRPYLFTSRHEMHLLSAPCDRIECIDNSASYTDVRVLWVLAEFMTNITFTIELILRICVAETLWAYVADTMNFLDILSIIPFYVELFRTLIYKGFDALNFSILASSPAPIFFVTMRAMKIFRMFKLTRHFNASKVIKETAQRAYKQILGMISFLAFMVILFAILLYQVESGKSCYVGDAGCHVPPDTYGLHVGDKIRINKDGQLTAFGNVFYGLWYSFVTLTTTGYGDIVAVTNAGQVMTIILMLVGQFYMAMPLTAAASTFYTVHELYNAKRAKVADEVSKAENKEKGITSEGAAGAGAGTTPLSAPPPAPDAPVVIYGDFLDRKLQKRTQNFLSEMLLLHTTVVEFYLDLHRTSNDFNEDAQDSQRAGYVEINNRKIPILQKLRTAGLIGQNKENAGKSPLLQQMKSIIARLERAISNSEEDILRVVVLHHKLRKNF